ncbi:hypothetical protein ACJX0J_021628, partial [Zea mays]
EGSYVTIVAAVCLGTLDAYAIIITTCWIYTIIIWHWSNIINRSNEPLTISRAQAPHLLGIILDELHL